MTAATATALVPVEQSKVAVAIDASSGALLELLPDQAAATRFKRVVIQALTKNPELLECTPESVVASVFEAAAMGLEPTGAAGGAHLVPYNKKVGRNPDRYEKQAQLIPDFRGVIRMVTRPDPKTGRPSEVISIEASAVKEGDDFAYQMGTDPWIQHVPSLAKDRSSKPTTHVYAVAQLRSGRAIPAVMDYAEVERVRQRARHQNPVWGSDWDEMAKKTVIKRLAKLLPVAPEVRSILAREDELEGLEVDEAPATVTTSAPRTKQLAARLRPAGVAQEPEPAPAADLFEGEPADEDVTEGQATEVEPSLVDRLRAAAERSGMQGAATAPQRERLTAAFAGVPTETVQAGIRAVFGHDRFTAAEAQAAITIADSLGDEAFRAEWAGLAG